MKKQVLKKIKYKINLIKYNIKFGVISLKLEKKIKKNKINLETVLYERLNELNKKSKNFKLLKQKDFDKPKKFFSFNFFQKNIVIKKRNLDNNVNIYLVNHQNVFEFFVISKIFNGLPLRAVVKRELKSFKFSKGFCYYDIDIDRSNPKSTIKLYKELKKSLEKNFKILIFPEGTRNKSDKPLLPFKENLGKLLTKFDVKIQGIAIKNLKEFLNGENKQIEIYFTKTYSSKEKNWYNNIYKEMYNNLKK